jgi:hypothetical protein
MASVSIEVGISGLDPLLVRLEFAPYVMDQEVGRAMEDSTGIALDAVHDLTPVGRTGQLYGSERGQSTAYFAELEGRVYTDESYAPYVEEGHSEITPKHLTKKGQPGFLRFRPRGSAQYVFTRRVRPVAGVHMFRRGLEMALPRVVDRFKDAVQSVARSIAA